MEPELTETNEITITQQELVKRLRLAGVLTIALDVGLELTLKPSPHYGGYRCECETGSVMADDTNLYDCVSTAVSMALRYRRE